MKKLLCLPLLTLLISFAQVAPVQALPTHLPSSCNADINSQECKDDLPSSCNADINSTQCQKDLDDIAEGGTGPNVFQDACSGAGSSSVLCQEANKAQTKADNSIFGKNGVLNKAANILLIVVGIATVVVVMIGGISYALSAGDSAKINKAKDMIIYAIIGMVVALVAKGIIVFVIDRL